MNGSLFHAKCYFISSFPYKRQLFTGKKRKHMLSCTLQAQCAKCLNEQGFCKLFQIDQHFTSWNSFKSIFKLYNIHYVAKQRLLGDCC